ncbi:MAG: DUF5928 domain-containing protein [Pseudomonadota bacterium]
MAKIAFLLLVHKDPARVVQQARALTVHGDCVAVHVDTRMPRAQFAAIRDGLKDAAGVTFARRVKCGWGEYSLCQATLNLIDAARAGFQDITHYFLVSGDCLPTKSRGYIDRFLTDHTDHIETHDFFDTDWIKTGLKRDRLVYRHLFNERGRKWWFYTSLNMQRRLKLERPLPVDLPIRIGSQWWALRAGTIEKIMELLRARRDIPRFFRTTWIPDETFIQTLVRKVVPAEEISGRPPTSLLFSDYGMPVVFQADHVGFLRSQDQPFARKISAHATAMHAELLEGFANWEAKSPEGGSGPDLYTYLAGRGRGGRRYRRRFWERAIQSRRSAEVLIVSAKLWHVGKAVELAAAGALNLPHLGYVFDEDRDLGLELGNLERGLYKRNEHRHAFLNLVFDVLGTDKLVLANQPGRLEVIDDVAGLAGEVRILLVDRPLSEAHLRDHALRTGLISSNSGSFEQREAISALRHEFNATARDLRDRFRGRVFANNLERPRDDNVTELGHFLRVTRNRADAVAREIEKYQQ